MELIDQGKTKKDYAKRIDKYSVKPIKLMFDEDIDKKAKTNKWITCLKIFKDYDIEQEKSILQRYLD